MERVRDGLLAWSAWAMVLSAAAFSVVPVWI